MTKSVRDEVLQVLIEKFDISPESVTDESRLREDLDLDSIDLFDMLGAIEKATGVGVDISDFASTKTFGDFVMTLSAILQADTTRSSENPEI